MFVCAEVGEVEGRAGDGASASGGSGAPHSAAPAAAATGAVDLGPMCCANFKVSEGAAEVCRAVGDFAAPSLLRELFRKMPLRDVLQSIEANTAKVARPPILRWFFFLYFFDAFIAYADPDANAGA